MCRFLAASDRLNARILENISWGNFYAWNKLKICPKYLWLVYY